MTSLSRVFSFAVALAVCGWAGVAQAAPHISQEPPPPGWTVDGPHSAVYGWATPGATLTVTAPGGYGAGQADASGLVWATVWQPHGDPLPLNASTPLTVFVDGVPVATLAPLPLQAVLNLPAHTLTGTLMAPPGTPLTLTLGSWNQVAQAGAPSWATQVDAAGAFTVSLPLTLLPTDMLHVTYPITGGWARAAITPQGPFVVQNFSWLAGYAPPGHTLTATVYITQSGAVRHQATTQAQPPYGLFGTDVQAEPGDTVWVTWESGATFSTTLADVHTVTFEAALDRVSGFAPSGATVSATLWRDLGATLDYTQASAVAVNGVFSLTVPTDLRPRDWVDVAVSDANGHAVTIQGGPPYVHVLAAPASEWDCVWGRVDAPGVPFTITAHTPEGVFQRTLPFGSAPGNAVGAPWSACYLVWQAGVWGPIDFVPGTVITLVSPTWSGAVTVGDYALSALPDTDQLTGYAPPGQVRVNFMPWRADSAPVGREEAHLRTITSAFAVTMTADVRPAGEASLIWFDPTTDFAVEPTFSASQIPFVELHTDGVSGRAPTPNETLTATLSAAGGAPLAVGEGDFDDDPFNFRFNFNMDVVQPGHWVTITGSSGWSAGHAMPALDLTLDVAADTLTANGPTDRLWLSYTPLAGDGRETWLPGPTATLPQPVELGDSATLTHQGATGHLASAERRAGEVHRVEMWLNAFGSTWLWGNGAPFSPLTLTTASATYTRTLTAQGAWNLEVQPPLAPGDSFTVTAGAGLYPVVIGIPAPLLVNADSQTDQVTGQIDGWANQMLQVNTDWGEGQEVTTDDAGIFTATLADVPRGGQGHIRWEAPVSGAQVVWHRPFRTADVILMVNYGHDWVETHYPPGHTVWLTVTDALGQLKATATGETAQVAWWSPGDTGFSTNDNVPWNGPAPNLQPGDVVSVSLSNGQASTARIGTLTGVVDVAADAVSVTVSAPWFTGTLDGFCGVWAEGGPGQGGIPVNAQGGTFACTFAPFDVLAGHDIGLEYAEPDGDHIINVVSAPAPHLQVTFNPQGVPASGANYPLRVGYANNGSAPAADTTLTLTLAGATYLTDTSGLPVTVNGNTLTWTLGTLPAAESWYEFEIFLGITAAPAAPVFAEAGLSTSTPYFQGDPWSRLAQWNEVAQTSAASVNVNLSTWTWNPAPGYTTVYAAGVCNHGATASAPATFTLTLPLSTTLVDWWAQATGWEAMTISAGQVVLARPSLPGEACHDVRVRAQVAANAQPGQPLQVSVSLTSTTDNNPNDNTASLNHEVGELHDNLRVDVGWWRGQTVPGADLYYRLTVNNWGNRPMPTVLTFTLPASTTWVQAFDMHTQQPLTPTQIGPVLVWDLGELENGTQRDPVVVVRLAPTAPAGLTLAAHAAVSVPPLEVFADDNTMTWLETVTAPAPNLRVRFRTGWHGDYAGHAWYELMLDNVGTTHATPAQLTVTLPVSVTALGDMDLEWWRTTGWGVDWATHQLTLTWNSLGAGESTWARFNTDFAVPLAYGLHLTHTAQTGSLPGETLTGDNTAHASLLTGPDLAVSLAPNTPTATPGQPFTLTAIFTNGQSVPWWPMQGQVVLTVTLPAGVSFITSTQGNCGGGVLHCERLPDVISGTQLVWYLWTFNPGEGNRLRLGVHISESVAGQAALSWLAEVASTTPADAEADTTNNHLTLAVPVVSPLERLFLPLIRR